MGTTHKITGGNGTIISVYECGNPNGQAIFLIHGFAQSCLTWNFQFNSSLADEFRLVAMDLRGHGMSDKPTDTESYTTSKFWADDVAAVIEQLGLNQPILAGWSYGGLVIGDYLECYGDSQIGGINFVGAAATLGTEEAETLIGSAVAKLAPGLMSDDLAENLATTREFILCCSAEPPSPELMELTLAFNMMVPPQVRRDLFDRAVHFGEVLKSVTVPTLVTQGTEDVLATPPMADVFLESIPHAVESIYQGIGHAPFFEDIERFNRELADLARQVGGSQEAVRTAS